MNTSLKGCAALAMLATCAIVAAPGSAKAGLLGGTADLTETLDLPSYGSGPRVLQALGASINGSIELSEANQTSNPSPWGDALTASLGDTTLTLTPTGFNEYQTITFIVANISASGQTITGVTQTTANAIDVANSSPFSESLTFTANSITVSYSLDVLDPSNLFSFGSGSDTFTITTAEAVPEPASMLVLGIGFIGMAARRFFTV